MSERTIAPAHYLLVFAGLLILTLLTMVAAAAPLGHWHTLVSLSIAGCKAALVILFYMHVLQSGRLTALVLIGALCWLGILIALTLSDYLTRAWLT